MAELALAAPVRYGKYTLLERLGSGGMAEVFLARQEGAGGFAKKVVIKRILSEFAQDHTFIEMFQAEAQLAAHLSHPNIVQIFDMGQEGDTFFIAMEYVAGPNLLQLLRYASIANDLRPQPFAKVASGVAEGLYYAHNALGPDGEPLHIVHRDINPPNIIVSLDGTPKICDFGVAKSATSEKTTGTQLKGKQTYMAPEQIRGERIDARADIFSLGVVLFETTTGKRLFKRDTELAVLNAVLSDPIPRPSQIIADYPQRLEEIIMWCLERDRDRRCPDARALHDSLEDYLRTEPGGGISQVALGDWLKSLLPDDARLTYTGSSSIGGTGTGSARRAGSSSGLTPRSRPGMTTSTPGPQTQTKTPGSVRSKPGGVANLAPFNPPVPPPAPPEFVEAVPISLSDPSIDPPAGGFSVPPSKPLPWKWIGLAAGSVLVGATLVVLLGRKSPAPEPTPAPVAAPANPAQPNAEDSARIYTEEARRLIGQGKFGPAAALVARAKGLNPQAPQTNVAIAELEEEAEVGARLAAAQQALSMNDYERVSSLAKLVLDKEPSQPKALELLQLARAKLAPSRPPPARSSGAQAALRIEAPAGSRVYVDDEPVGEAPVSKYTVSAGVHRVEVRRDGYRPEIKEVKASAGQTTTVVAKMDAQEQVRVALENAALPTKLDARPAKPEVKQASVAVPVSGSTGAPAPVAVTPPPAPTPGPPQPVATVPAPTPTPAAPTVVGEMFSDQMTRPVRISGDDPTYPSDARTARIEGTVIAQCAVSEEGSVHSCRILKHLPFMDQPVLSALQTWRMKPATLNGKPVALRSYPFTIKLVAPK